MFISIEGIDGSGKTTQAKLLHEFVQNYILENPDFADGSILTNEPNDGRLSGYFDPEAASIEKMTLGQIVRSIIGLKDDVDETERLLLIYAARRQHVQNVVAPAVAKKMVVICDRFYDSSIAYFGYKEDVGFERAKRFVDLLHGESLLGLPAEATMPQVTFYIDTEPKVSLDRMRQRNLFDRLDRMEEKDVESIRSIFLRLAKEDPKRCIMIDGNRTPEEVRDSMVASLRGIFAAAK